MKPYDDPDCECHKIEAAIKLEYPKCDWNLDNACRAWQNRSGELVDNGIEFAPYSDDAYGCTCPTCGRFICGWCV
jgi:hypothetical protein